MACLSGVDVLKEVSAIVQISLVSFWVLDEEVCNAMNYNDLISIQIAKLTLKLNE